MENKLELIVRESGLEKTKADIILKKFQDYFAMASEWEKKAKTIVVTNETQVADMKMARIGRLELKEKRVAIENTRKELKEQALREGKAIDGIANVLKALIVPIEEYLEKQEKFIEFKKAAEEEARRIAVERRMEEERIAEEKRKAEEQERLRIENERLRKEAEEREKKIMAERKAQEKKLAAERAKAEAEKKALEEKARVEREKAESERRKAEEKAAKEREAERAKAEAERKEKERLAEIIKNTVECPNCHHKFQLTGKK